MFFNTSTVTCCARWNTGCRSSTVAAGSLAECIKNCPHYSKYMLLKGDLCRCFTDEACIQRTSDPCDDHCRNNPNDWCGGGFGTEALYHTGPYGNISFSVFNAKDVSCYLLITDEWTTTSDLINAECETTVTRNILCKRRSTVLMRETVGLINWYSAADVCQSLHAHLYFDLPEDMFKKGKNSYWTSLRKVLKIKWTKHNDKEYPFCVSIRLNHQSKPMLYAEDCSAAKNFLFLKGSNQNEECKDANEQQIKLIMIFCFILSLLCVILVFFICYRRLSSRLRSQMSSPINEGNKVTFHREGQLDSQVDARDSTNNSAQYQRPNVYDTCRNIFSSDYDRTITYHQAASVNNSDNTYDMSSATQIKDNEIQQEPSQL